MEQRYDLRFKCFIENSSSSTKYNTTSATAGEGQAERTLLIRGFP